MMKYIISTTMMIWLLLLCSSQVMVANNTIVPKLVLNKTEIDYCSESTTAKEFVISLDIGNILPEDSLFSVNIAFAYNRDKVIIDMPLLTGTLSEQFKTTCTAVWDEYDYTYNYYNFQAYNIYNPVYGNRPLVSFKGRFLTADTIDETDFSIAVIEFAEEFQREYVTGNEDTVRLYARPVKKENRTITINADVDTLVFDGNINKDTLLVNYNLNVAQLKHFESFDLEIGINDFLEDFEIFDVELNNNFEWEIIEREKNKLLLKVNKKENIDNLVNEFCKLSIRNLNVNNEDDTIRTYLYTDINNINGASCSMLAKLDTVTIISNKLDKQTDIDDGEEEEDDDSIINNKNIKFEYNYINHNLLINICDLSEIYIYDVFGRQMQIIPKISNQFIEVNLSNLCSGIYFVELKKLDNIIYRKKLTIN